MTKPVHQVGVPTQQELLRARNEARKNLPDDLKNDDRVNPAAFQGSQGHLEIPAYAQVSPAPVQHQHQRIHPVFIPDGPRIDMGQPPYATQAICSKIMGQNPAPMDMIWVKPLMYVRAIDGHAVDYPKDRNAAQDLMNRIGDYGMELVISAHQKFWPPINSEILGEAKKNL